MSFHLYQINEVYSNADGSVQFIELLGTANGQELFNQPSAILTVTQDGTTHSFHTTNDLNSSSTNGKTVLFATPGFQALTGVAPDYTIPAGFLFTSGSQTISWGVDTLTVPVLPLEGGLSVGQNGTTTAINTPKNFAGLTGTVPFNHAPTSADLLDDVFTGAGQLFSLTVPANDFTDADDDPLTYTATLANDAALPAWLSFDDGTLVLSGTPAGGDVGTIQVKITAGDADASASDTFALTVLNGLVLSGDGDGDSLTGAGDDDLISGRGGEDSLDGGAGNDIIDGGTGNDTLNGGAGADVLTGGADNDTYVIADSDTVVEGSAGGVDTVLASVGYVLGANVENLTLTGGAAVNGIGNSLANVINGNSGDNHLDGAGGNDTLAGGDGDDTYTVDAGDVVVEASGEGHDSVIAAVRFALPDNVEDLTLADKHVTRGTGNELDNAITGNPLRDLLVGGAGNDTLDGGARGDIMVGGFGDDTYFVDSRDDRVGDGPGDDTVIASVSFDLAAAPGVENLVLTGGAGRGSGNALDNMIEGNASANRLNGRDGDDTLSGAAGNDTLTGGEGADQFHFDSLVGVDRLTDFESGVDQLVFDGDVFTGELDYDADSGRLLHDGQLIAVLEHAGELLPQDFVIL